MGSVFERGRQRDFRIADGDVIFDQDGFYGDTIGKRLAVKLSQREIEQVQVQMKAEPMPGDHPALPYLETSIGDHTFYIGSDGVFIWESASDNGEGDGAESKRIIAMRVASWADDDKHTVAIHKPQLTETVIKLSEGGRAEDELPGNELPKDVSAKEKITKDDADPLE